MTSDQAPQGNRRRAWARPAVLVPVGLVFAAMFAVALYLFEPWTLFTNEVVDEALPTAVPAATAPTSTESTSPSPNGSNSPEPSAEPVPSSVGPVELASGAFISHEHGTTGQVRVLELEDGSRVLRIEGLDTSNGPDLRVWITDAPVIEGRDGWFVFDDGAYVDLGALKGNQGNQNYALPNSVDLEELTSVSIWCQRFRVSFGAAELS